MRVIAVAAGLGAGFASAEVAYRYFLFGWPLSYEAAGLCEQAPADGQLVTFFGDSFAAGYPFGVQDSFPLLLEHRLRNSSARIVNCAHPRNNLYDQVNDMRRVVARQQPRLAVWALSTEGAAAAADDWASGKNSPRYVDPRDWTTPIAALDPPAAQPLAKKWAGSLHLFLGLVRDSLAHGMSPFSTAKEVLLNYTYVYGPIKSFVEEQHAGAWLRADVTNHPEQREVSNAFLTAYRKSTRSLMALEAIQIASEQFAARGIPFVLVYLPQESDVNDALFRTNVSGQGQRLEDYDRRGPRRVIREFCEARGITFVDPSDAMEGEIEHGRHFFMSFDRHYTRSGQAWLADFLARDRRISNALRPEPSPGAARSELRLLGDERFRRFLKRSGRFRSAQKIDVHAADLPVSELDIARTLSLVRLG